MSPPLVIAYGNPLRGDDGVAWAIADGIEERPGIGDVTVIARQALGPELVEPIASASRVVFVDARAGGVAGTVTCEPVAAVLDQEGRRALGHAMTPAALIALTTTLSGRAVAAALVTVSAGSFEFGESLSEPVIAAVPRAIDVVATCLADLDSPVHD